MESPVVVDKPPEYHGNERGFPFDEEDGSGAWSELAARHPDIAARLRQRPATWARKRRPSSQDATDDFGESFSGFDRFPFDDIPPEFREHFPTHWNRRFNSREEPPQTQAAPQSPSTQQTTATQTEQDPGPSEPAEQAHLPQYGLRNTVDLGQKSPADPSLVDADERNQRSMSAPPDSSQNQSFKMSGQNHEQSQPEHSNVRHIPIFVEGRDEPVINRSADAHFAEKQYVPPPQVDRDQYFADEPVGFHHPPNFSRAFGTPFNKGYRQGPQPFQQQKAYPHAAFARGASPQRSQSPKPPQPQPQPQAQPQPHHEEHYVKVPVQHEQSAPRPQPQQRQPPPPQPQQKQPSPQKEDTPPPQPKPTSNDPITQILSIQTDVLNLMTEVENFTGTKKDKRYLFLDEMLTRNLIKLDNIETDGKENIRQARKEAIKCIQKCIAVLEAKADSNMQAAAKDIEMKENVADAEQADTAKENGEVDMKEIAKEEPNVETTTQAEQPSPATPTPQSQPQEAAVPSKPEEEKPEADSPPQEQTKAASAETKEVTQTEAADTRPETNVSEQPSETTEEQKEKLDKSKKGTKVVKQRNKSKDNKDKAKDSDSKQEIEADRNKEETAEVDKKENVDVMQVDEKGDKTEQVMEVDGAASQ